jgi:deoxyribose-phosphate aldolase
MILKLTDFRKRLEYSLCQQFAGEEDVGAFCDRALAAGVGVVCVNPVNVSLAAKLIEGADMELSSNVGFPFGTHYTEAKVLETRMSVEQGATQIDMVIDVGALRSGNDSLVEEDIRAVVEAAAGRMVKTIIETWVLNDEEKERACRIAERAGAAMVKTTTGVRTQYLLQFTDEPKGAVLNDILLMRRTLSSAVGIKASGGIYTLDYALDLLRAGADQLGVSRGDGLADEFVSRFGEQVDLGGGGR